MRFTPKTEKEIREAGLLTPGVYDFEVISAEDCVSQAGNEQIKLKLRVFGPTSERLVWDYLSTASDAMEAKFRHFCEAAGLLDQYNTGEVSAITLAAVSGRAKIGISKDKNGTYPDRNDVKDYVRNDTPTTEATTEANTSFDADNIPF